MSHLRHSCALDLGFTITLSPSVLTALFQPRQSCLLVSLTYYAVTFTLSAFHRVVSLELTCMMFWIQPTSLWIISSTPAAFLSFFKTLTVFLQPFPWCQRHSKQSFGQYLVPEWKKFSRCTLMVGVLLLLLGSELSEVGRQRPAISVTSLFTHAQR